LYLYPHFNGVSFPLSVPEYLLNPKQERNKTIIMTGIILYFIV
jgi:hypothetical protein